MIVPTTSYWFTVSTAMLLFRGWGVLSNSGSRLTLCYLVRNLQKWVWPFFETDTSTSLQAVTLLLEALGMRTTLKPFCSVNFQRSM